MASIGNLACKDPKLVEENDFFFSGLHKTGNVTNFLGSKVTPIFAAQLLGVTTLGISMARIDFAPWGVNPPHTHPRATEIITVLDGSLEVGFITLNPENRHFSKVLQKGDVFVFPIRLIHYQRNVGYGNAIAIAARSSQNPEAVTIGNALFGANPEISSVVLTKAFHLDKPIISYLRSKF